MLMYWAPFNTWEYTTYAMMAWYSRERSSFNSSARRSREISFSFASVLGSATCVLLFEIRDVRAYDLRVPVSIGGNAHSGKAAGAGATRVRAALAARRNES